MISSFWGVDDRTRADDDLLISTDLVARRLRQYRLPVSPKSTSLVVWSKTLIWCGFEITEDSIRVDPECLEGLQCLSPPRTGDELVKFIGAAQWISDHIPNFAVLIRPLVEFKTEILSHFKRKTKQNARKVDLTVRNDYASLVCQFHIVQKAVGAAVALRHPPLDARMIIFTDASQNAWGGFVCFVTNENTTQDVDTTTRSLSCCVLRWVFRNHQIRWHA